MKEFKYNRHRIHGKYLIIDIHFASGCIYFVPDSKLEESTHTYDIDKAKVFNTKKEAELFLETHEPQLCPSIVYYLIARKIAKLYFEKKENR